MFFIPILFVIVSVNNTFGLSDCELFNAAYFNDLPRLKAEITRSTTVDCRNTNHRSYGYGWTPLMVASDYNNYGNAHAAVVAEILAVGADPNLETSYGLTALMYASRSSYPGNTDVLQLLVDNGANINHVCNNGSRPLHYAISPFGENTTDVAAILLRAGAAKNVRDNDGNTPYDLAMNFGYSKLATFIDDFGVTHALTGSSSVTKSSYITNVILSGIFVIAIVCTIAIWL